MNHKSWIYFPKYVNVMNEYLTHFSHSNKFMKKDKDSVYLLINGFNIITHIFNFALIYTHNIDLVVSNMRQAIVYYTQFIDQIEENILYDLNLSSNNASIFVYKKTIYDLVKGEDINDDNKQMFINLNKLITIYKGIFGLFVIDSINSIDYIIYKITAISRAICDYDILYNLLN